MPKKKLTPQEQQAQDNFRATVPQTALQKKASDQSVPLEAFKKPSETQQQFQDRATANPTIQPTVTAQAINQRTQLQSAVDVQRQQDVTGVESTIQNITNPQDATAQGNLTTGQRIIASLKQGGTPVDASGKAILPPQATAPILTPSLIPAMQVKTAENLSKLSNTNKFIGGSLITTAVGLLTRGRQKELEADIKDNAASTRTWAKLAVQNPDIALQNIEDIESQMIQLLGKLHLSFQTDPIARLQGKDIEEFARRQLLIVQNAKGAVRQYKLDGDMNRLNAVLGTDPVDVQA